MTILTKINHCRVVNFLFNQSLDTKSQRSNQKTSDK